MSLLEEKDRPPQIFCFNGSCLNALKSKDDDFFKQTLEIPLQQHKSTCRYLIFPLYHEPDNEKKEGVGHWTFMYADLQEVKYFWYNSMRPLPGEKDEFIEDAKSMKRYVHQNIFPIEDSSTIPRFDLLISTPEEDAQFQEITTAPQQPRPSYDCAIYVMKWIRDMFFEGGVPGLQEKIENLYRARICATIINDEKTLTCD